MEANEELHERKAAQGDEEHALAEELRRLRAEVERLVAENVVLRRTVQQHELLDPLTGLFNRAAFDGALAREVERSRRYGRKLSLIVLDVDGMGIINERYGLPAGDAVLERVGKAIGALVRRSDVTGRFEGDRFGLLLPEIDLEGAAHVAERIYVEAVGTPVEAGGKKLIFKLRHGAVEWEPDEGPESLYARAAQALMKHP